MLGVDEGGFGNSGGYIEECGGEVVLFFFELDEVLDFFESASLVEIQEDSVEVVFESFLSLFEFGSFQV